MKVLFAAVLSLISSASAIPEISANSQMGQNLLSHARRLENAEEEWDGNNNWVAGYSVKFQGCVNIKQWNDDADEEEDVKIQTKSLVRFRMCPSDTCSATKAAGCTSGYGDYVIDMATFMEAHIEAVRQIDEVNCENYANSQCNCEDDDDKDDGFDRDYCEYDCFNDAEMYECIERNPYDDDEQDQDQFDIDEYLECKEIEIPEENRRRRLEDNGEEEEVQYFVGPYCGSQGGEIYMGLFSDDTCTEMVDDEEISFESLMGFSLPYSDPTSLVSSKCIQCVEPVRDDENDQNGDQEDEDNILESCETLYMGAGKCENKLPSGMVYEVNDNACTYMEGIRIVRHDGFIDAAGKKPSAVATAFIVVAAMAFAAMAFYVWYLRTRLGVKQNTLL